MRTMSRTFVGVSAAVLAAVSVLSMGAVSAAGAQEFSSVTPVRDLDTRTNHSVVLGNSTVALTAAQLHVQAGNTAVLNVTVTQPTNAGFLTVYPGSGATPTASTLNFLAGKTVTNLVMVPIGGDGTVDFHYTGTGSLALIVDTVGELGAGLGHDSYVSVNPSRILDTRYGIGGVQGPIGGDTRIGLTVANNGGVPAGADAVVVNLTTTDTENSGFLKAYSSDLTSLPITSVSNWAKGQTVANLAVVQIGSDGKIDLVTQSDDSAQFIADVVGYFTKSDTDGLYTPGAQPVRVLDTRYGIGTGGTPAKIGPKGAVLLHLGGVNGVPSTGKTAVYLNLTATNATGTGYLTLTPYGGSDSTSSSLNFSAGVTVANATVMPLGDDGDILVTNGGATPVDVIADLYGFFNKQPAVNQ